MGIFKSMCGNIPGRDFLGGNFPGEIFQGGSLMVGNFPSGNFPGRSFPDTLINIILLDRTNDYYHLFKLSLSFNKRGT